MAVASPQSRQRFLVGKRRQMEKCFFSVYRQQLGYLVRRVPRLTSGILYVLLLETERGNHFCLGQPRYIDTAPTSRERAAKAGIEPKTSSEKLCAQPLQPVGSGQPKRGSNPRPPSEKLCAQPTKLPRLRHDDTSSRSL